MITLTRRQAHRLRTIFRRSVLGIGHRGSIAPLVLHAEGTQLRAQYRYAGLAVDHTFDVDAHGSDSIALPLDALADIEGRDESPVTLEAAAPDRTVVHWTDRGIPQTRDYTVPALDALAPFPDLPRSWTELPAGLLDALAEATITCCDDSTRYALNSILLRASTGEIVATDGHQILIQGGFRFPFTGDVLVKRSPIFANKALPREMPVSVGKTDTFVVLRAGSWTLFLEVQDGRFPRIDQVIPDAQATTTRLRLDAGDASFLAQALDRLPGADGLHSPATLDLNGRIAVRARGADQTQATELVLAHSSYTGTPVRINANREFLARAIRLGFPELEIVDADSPVVLRDRERVFGFQPLSKESAIEPADDVIRIESPSLPPCSTPKANITHEGPFPMSETTTPVKPPKENGRHLAGEHPHAGSLAALIQETEALHEVLTDARARAGRLTVALRRYRRRERLVSQTLASLKALKLQEVAG